MAALFSTLTLTGAAGAVWARAVLTGKALPRGSSMRKLHCASASRWLSAPLLMTSCNASCAVCVPAVQFTMHSMQRHCCESLQVDKRPHSYFFAAYKQLLNYLSHSSMCAAIATARFSCGMSSFASPDVQVHCTDVAVPEVLITKRSWDPSQKRRRAPAAP